MKRYTYHPNNGLQDSGEPSLPLAEIDALLKGRCTITMSSAARIHHVQSWTGDMGTYYVEPMAYSLAGPVLPAGAVVLGITQQHGTPGAIVRMATGVYVQMLGGIVRSLATK